MNNPIRFIDPDGMDGVSTVDKENMTIAISQTFYYNKNDQNLKSQAIGYAEKGDYPAPIYTGFIYAFYINRIV